MTLCVCGCIGSQLHHAGSFIVVHRSSSYMACRLSCSMACGILVPQPGIEPASPALQSRFLTTGLPGKSSAMTIMENIQGSGGKGMGGGGGTGDCTPCTAGLSGKDRFSAASIGRDPRMQKKQPRNTEGKNLPVRGKSRRRGRLWAREGLDPSDWREQLGIRLGSQGQTMRGSFTHHVTVNTSCFPLKGLR